MSKLNYKKIKEVLYPIIKANYKNINDNSNIDKNTLDCFSCIIECMIRNISIEKWFVDIERIRQTQKKLQNDIGIMHQKILGTLDYIKDLGNGNGVDIESDKLKLVAEIKNKHNTTKGNHLKVVYDDIENYLKTKPDDFTGYYVEILPKNGKKYNKPFTPTHRPENQNIRQIDGYSFYKLVTGEDNALKTLYDMLPGIIQEILEEEFNIKVDINKIDNKNKREEIFNKIY